MTNKENILVIKHGALGDLIQADGLYKSIRGEYKNAKIILLTSKKFVDLMERCPYFDGFILDDRPSVFSVISYINLYKEIIKYNFKIIYDLQNSQRTYIYRHYFFKKINWISTNREGHAISGLRGLEEMLRGSLTRIKYVSKPELNWLPIDVKSLIREKKITSKYIVLLPGSSKSNPLKRWPYFKELASMLICRGFEIVTILGPEELEMDNFWPGHILKNLDLSQLAGVIKNSYFIIGNDSGPCHIASCLNKKGLALFGPTTSVIRSELKRGRFEILKVSDLKNLTPKNVLNKVSKFF